MILENKPMARSGAGYDWEDYYGYDEIVSFMEGLAANDDDINVIDIGKTYEGRDMKVHTICVQGKTEQRLYIYSKEFILDSM